MTKVIQQKVNNGTGFWSWISFPHQAMMFCPFRYIPHIVNLSLCVNLSPGLGVSEIGIGKHSEAGREGGDLAKPIIECLLEVRKPAVVIHVALLRSVNAQQWVMGYVLSLPQNYPRKRI